MEGWRFPIISCFLAVVFLLFAAVAAADTDTNLKFKVLPSAEGWTYTSDLTVPPPEASVFSVSDRVLTQTTDGSPFQSEHYEIPGTVDPNKKATLFMRARVLAEGGNYFANSFGFCYSLQTGTEAFGIGLGTHRTEDENGQFTTAIDNTVFHDHLLRMQPGVGFEYFVDGDLVLSGPPRFIPVANRVLFGDCTNGAGAHAEVTRFQFHQGD
jgi:hypothetical protein